MAYMRLGDLLVSSSVITNEQMEKALGMQKETKERLGDVLIRAGFITEQQLIEALEMQLGVEFVDLTAVSIPVELASYVPKNIAKKFCVVPVKLVKDTLYLAMSDPLDFVAQEEVKVASRKRVIPMIATRRTTEHAISLLYGNEGTARVIEEMKREAGSSTPDIVPVQFSQEAMDSGDRRRRSALSTASLNARFPSARAISTWSRRTAKWSCVCVSTVFCAACLRPPPNCRAPSSRASRSWAA